MSLAFAAACGDSGKVSDDDDDNGVDAASSVDADPNAPDADLTAPDADVTAPDADTTAPDGGGGGSEGVACGAMSCMGDQICCVTQGGMGGMTQMCAAEGDCQGLSLSCDGPEDCGGGEMCCGSGGGGGGGTTCQSDGCQAVICHTEADCPGMDDMCCPVAMSGICSPFCL